MLVLMQEGSVYWRAVPLHHLLILPLSLVPPCFQALTVTAAAAR
jgi:hypothetical protein